MPLLDNTSQGEDLSIWCVLTTSRKRTQDSTQNCARPDLLRLELFSKNTLHLSAACSQNRTVRSFGSNSLSEIIIQVMEIKGLLNWTLRFVEFIGLLICEYKFYRICVTLAWFYLA